jgi:hypothetical protein
MLPKLSLANIDWVFAGDNKNISVYTHIASIKREGGLATGLDLFNYKVDRLTEKNKIYRSILTLTIYDCEHKLSKVINMQFFELSFGKGELIEVHDIQFDWSEVLENTLEEGLFEFSCKGTKMKVT